MILAMLKSMIPPEETSRTAFESIRKVLVSFAVGMIVRVPPEAMTVSAAIPLAYSEAVPLTVVLS